MQYDGDEDLTELTTEQRNPNSLGIDTKSTGEILRIIAEEDQKVPLAVERAVPHIEPVVEAAVERLSRGGRLFYVGAGTSGRLGVLDAAECPPTYGTDPEMIQGVIAGGEAAMFQSIEGAEDSDERGAEEMRRRRIGSDDLLIGITASGGAPFVLGAMREARSQGAATAGLACNKNTPIFAAADYEIYVDVGPEIVTGSTRMKAGTAQKLVLNMISTTSMIKLGKVYNNLMVDLKPVNKKLVRRSKRIIALATGCSWEEAEAAFEAAGERPKVAIVMLLLGISAEEAAAQLKDNQQRVGLALKAAGKAPW